MLRFLSDDPKITTLVWLVCAACGGWLAFCATPSRDGGELEGFAVGLLFALVARIVEGWLPRE